MVLPTIYVPFGTPRKHLHTPAATQPPPGRRALATQAHPAAAHFGLVYSSVHGLVALLAEVVDCDRFLCWATITQGVQGTCANLRHHPAAAQVPIRHFQLHLNWKSLSIQLTLSCANVTGRCQGDISMAANPSRHPAATLLWLMIF